MSRAPMARNVSTMSTASTSTTASTTSKNKGVQMVSEMRARVRVLEQKIHTRVPRFRVGSLTGKPNANAQAAALMQEGNVSPSPSSASTTSTAVGKTSWDSLSTTQRRSVDSRRSNDSESEKGKKNSGRDSSGWVLIMEDSPSPPKERVGERRRTSSPTAPTAFRPAASTSIPSPTLGSNKANPLYQSSMGNGLRRPSSRLSGSSLSTTTTTSSIPTSISRPSTPTFLPVPTGGLYAHSATSGLTGLKRSTGPGGPSPYVQNKRASLGASTAMPPPSDNHRDRPTSMSQPSRPASGTPSSGSSRSTGFENAKALPQLPGLHANITMRPSGNSKLPSSGSSLAKSRIGRPSSTGISGRRSVGDGDGNTLDPKKELRPRAGSTTAAFGSSEA